MRIGIDAFILKLTRGGTGLYVTRLLESLAAIDETNEYVVFGPPAKLPPLSGHPNFDVRPVSPNIPYPVWEQLLLPFLARRERLDVLHCPAVAAPVLFDCGTEVVMTIHDLIAFLPPGIVPSPRTLRQRLGKFYRRMVLSRAAHRACLILTVSKSSKADIERILKISPAGVRTIYHGTALDLALQNGAPQGNESTVSLHPDSRFILCLGAHDPRKNTDTIVRAYAQLRAMHEIPEMLVVAGLNPQAARPFKSLAEALGVSNHVVFPGRVSDRDLFWLYKHARCFLYPSLYEGFGLPVVEAMGLGAPVIASCTGSIPEVAGDACLLIDPSSEIALCEAMLRVLQDEALHASLIERGRIQASKFTWKATARETLAAYSEVVAQNEHDPRGRRLA